MDLKNAILIHIPRNAAFLIRNKLNVMRIPYRDIKVEVIGVREEHYDQVLKILSEIQRE
ncbi:MAG: hypothetical protein H0Z28_12335 [Archaeoglobus sp.]|nr:hypothetical protein [Archaeoglobus sp.]